MKKTDCDKCSRPCGYARLDWFSEASIRFCRVQMVFLIGNLWVLKDGKYPPDPSPNNYIDPGVQGQRNYKAPFEKPAQLFAEVDSRLQMLPPADRELLETVIQYGETVESMGHTARQALNYCSGWRRRRMSFSDWKKHKTYREKKEA